ncbi:restriction endonuclease-related protein [Streptomyces sp. NPDC001273]|uniref:restriction endonuclease-related protein n=1 Tax=unclassified Streptomyces TaxID=2593676 RepID=UPI0033C989E9
MTEEHDAGGRGVRERLVGPGLDATQAFAVCGDALTNTKLDGAERLVQIMEAQGLLMAAAGPGHPVRFADLLDRLGGEMAGSLEGLMPGWASPPGLDALRFLDKDGFTTEDAFDYRYEVVQVIRAARKVGRLRGRVTLSDLQGEYKQETVYASLKGNYYRVHRENLVRNPAVTVEELRKLRLPPPALDFFEDIPTYMTHQGYWFRCPACAWPMKITVEGQGATARGSVQCLYPWHAETGASYIFTPVRGQIPVLDQAVEVRTPSARHRALYTGAVPGVPQALPAAGYKALARDVWRYTTIPGLPEVRLYEVLAERLADSGVQVMLWPDNDAYDLLVARGEGRGQQVLFTVDFKDYRWSNQLVGKLRADGGDKGQAGWIVVPDHRASQIPQLTEECRRHGMQAATATDFLERVVRTVKEGGGR